MQDKFSNIKTQNHGAFHFASITIFVLEVEDLENGMAHV